MISSFSSYPWVVPWNILSAVSFFLLYGKAHWKVSTLTYGSWIFCCTVLPSVLSENATLFYRTDPYPFFRSYQLCYAVLALE